MPTDKRLRHRFCQNIHPDPQTPPGPGVLGRLRRRAAAKRWIR